MSACPDEQGSKRHYKDTSPSGIETVANELVALVEEFEAEINEGHVSPAFAERLAELRQAADRPI